MKTDIENVMVRPFDTRRIQQEATERLHRDRPQVMERTGRRAECVLRRRFGVIETPGGYVWTDSLGVHGIEPLAPNGLMNFAVYLQFQQGDGTVARDQDPIEWARIPMQDLPLELQAIPLSTFLQHGPRNNAPLAALLRTLAAAGLEVELGQEASLTGAVDEV